MIRLETNRWMINFKSQIQLQIQFVTQEILLQAEMCFKIHWNLFDIRVLHKNESNINKCLCRYNWN